MKNVNYKVEFDPSFVGGEYMGTSNQVLVPEDMVVELGSVAGAFEKVTGHKAENIIFYADHLRFNETGLEIQLPVAGEVDLPAEPAVEIAAASEVVVAEPVDLVVEEPAAVIVAEAVQAEAAAPAAGWRV